MNSYLYLTHYFQPTILNNCQWHFQHAHLCLRDPTIIYNCLTTYSTLCLYATTYNNSVITFTTLSINQCWTLGSSDNVTEYLIRLTHQYEQYSRGLLHCRYISFTPINSLTSQEHKYSWNRMGTHLETRFLREDSIWFSITGAFFGCICLFFSLLFLWLGSLLLFRSLSFFSTFFCLTGFD